jgi:WD40 repeat protein
LQIHKKISRKSQIFQIRKNFLKKLFTRNRTLQNQMQQKQIFSYSLPRPPRQRGREWHYCGINAITRNPVDGSIWTGGRDGLLIQSRKGKSIINDAHIDWVNDVLVKDGVVFSASSDRSVVIWKEDYHVALYYHNGMHPFSYIDYVKCLANPVDSVNIVSGGLDRNIIAWDTQQNSNQVVPIHTSKTGIYSLATNNSGSVVVYGGPDGLLKILDTRISQADSNSGVSLTGMDIVFNFSGHKDTVKSILFHDTTLITGGADSICKIWDIRYLSQVF